MNNLRGVCVDVNGQWNLWKSHRRELSIIKLAVHEIFMIIHDDSLTAWTFHTQAIFTETIKVSESDLQSWKSNTFIFMLASPCFVVERLKLELVQSMAWHEVQRG
jgi:hypothetical protein